MKKWKKKKIFDLFLSDDQQTKKELQKKTKKKITLNYFDEYLLALFITKILIYKETFCLKYLSKWKLLT